MKTITSLLDAQNLCQADHVLKEEITFSVSGAELLDCLSLLLDFEESKYDNKNITGTCFDLNLKGLSTEDLTKVLKLSFNRESLVNTNLLLNLAVFVNGYSTFDDSLFNSKEIFVQSIEQILDIKLELLDDIKAFRQQCCFYFLSCLKSMHKVEYTNLDPLVQLPMIYKRFMLSTNLMNISTMLNKADNIQTKDLVLVEDAFPVVMEIMTTSAIANKLIQNFDFEKFLK